MIVVRYAVCSERERKPVTRGVYDIRAEADRALEHLRQVEAAGPEEAYWIAELGPESESWRHLGVDVEAA